ncbi:segregation/condensation protein A [Spirulina sp. CS-785/01]|uniref:segregation/condensation protein A n=1 Tax=Spirulina sp. CS-785/01 TaxID=3021716 RepID=UPI00232BD259|nr:segregation/condensation protein A [Spirulina sp. CS-785/01]MDB9313433.1 segregation/condensation protein A [Spirulina sp. CS-785/01]
MPQNFAQEAIAVLLDLAQRGEIDPWDVQVIDVIDRYLSKLTLTDTPQPGTETADLSQSGQAFLWASMLVLLKANTLEQLEEEEEEEEGFEEDLDPLNPQDDQPLPPRLEKHIRRRPTAPPLRRRRVTLQELIQQIQQMATVLETKPPAKPRQRTQTRKATVRQISELAHNENLTEMAGQLEAFFLEHLGELNEPENAIALEPLIQWWATYNPQPDHASPNHHRVGVFWALLLLSAQSKVELSQEEFYQDLAITPLLQSLE